MTAAEQRLVAHVAHAREQRLRDWGVKPSPVVKRTSDDWGTALGFAIAILATFALGIRW